MGGKSFYWHDPKHKSLWAMLMTLAQTGMRKAEVSLASGVAFSPKHLSMQNVSWKVGTSLHPEMTPALFEEMRRVGGYALLRPPPSKADQFSLHWGACTIYLRYSPDEKINAARELALEELRRAVPLAERKTTPLFVTEGKSVWRHTELSALFFNLMVAVSGKDRAKQLSIHSWRVYLACVLLASGASTSTIQCMLRWRSEDALRIYARINDFKYADWLSAAG